MQTDPHETASSGEDARDREHRTIVVTGANSGLGLETARACARTGAHVVLVCRDRARGEAALAEIQGAQPWASLGLECIDLASLASIRSGAAALASRHPRIDRLCNNAGVMALPRRQTADGFEMQLGTNHLGHFALTGLLLDPLLASPAARVVTLSSGAHKMGRMRFDDLHGERGYSPWRAYAQSKLSNLLFTFELQRRLEAAGARAIALAAHPGYAATNLQLVGPRMTGSLLGQRVMEFGNRIFAQDAAAGALPTLQALLAPDAKGGDYWGPDGPFEAWGRPKRVRPSAHARDRAAAARLWEVSTKETGIEYDFSTRPAPAGGL